MLSDPSFTKSMAALVGVGWVLVVSVVVGTFLGKYLDGKLGTSPWLLIAGAVLGLTAGVLHIWRVIKRSSS